MIKEFFNHPEPFHSHSGHVGMDSRGESIKLSIFKLATVLGDHVSNTDIHVQSSITDEDIDDIVDVPSDSAQKATEYVTSEFLKQMYYTKMDIDQMGFLKQLPDGFATEDYVNDRIRTQKEELEKYAASLIGDYVKPDDYNIFQNTVNSKLNTLTDKYVSLDQRVTGLSSDVSSLKSDVSSLKSRVSVLEKNGTGGSGTGGSGTGGGGSDNPGGSGTGGGTGGSSDSHKKTTVTYMPTVTKTTKGSYEIGTLYVDGEESTIWGKDNATTVINGGDPVDPIKCATIQAYKAEKPNITNIDKPGSFTTDNDTHLQITIFPSGWYSTLAQAVNAFGSNNASLWVSQITLYSDGTNSGWSTPQIYVNVQGLIQQATDDAQKYYKGQIEDANSEINKVIADAKSQLKILNDRINQGDEGHPDTSWREPVNKLVSEVNEYGWKVHEDLSVTYAERLFNAVEGEIVTRAGIADGTGGIRNAIQVITADFIKQQVYDYSANGKIDSSVLNLTPTQIVLKALEGIENPGDAVGKALNSAVIDIVKNRITLSIANDSGNGAQFVLKIDGNGVSQATLDTSKFVVTGDMIVNAINTHGISIQSKEETGTIVASIDSNGEARFGKGTTIFKEDGSGATACGNIKWDKNGSLQITGLMTDKSVTTNEEWDIITNELVKKGDETIGEIDRYFQIVNPMRATSYFIPTIDPEFSVESPYKIGPEVVFLPMYISNDQCKLIVHDDAGVRDKTYVIPKYQTAGTRVRISKGPAIYKYSRWAYVSDSEYERLWTGGNAENRTMVRNIYGQGTLLCADPRIFTVHDSSIFNIQGRNPFRGTKYAHGRFSINGVTARMLWLMPGQTVELVSQIETINNQQCLVWQVVNSDDFTIANVNVDIQNGDAKTEPIMFPGESSILNPENYGGADNWSDAFIAHKKINNSILNGNNKRELPRLYIVRNIMNNGSDYNYIVEARFDLPANK